MTQDEHNSASHLDRVSWKQLIAYGTGGVIPIALFNVAGQLIALLGNISLGLSAFWLGAILLVPRLWDAFSDPIVGHLSDNTRSRWGRRRPYIAAGGIFVALSFVCMWWVPRDGTLISDSETVQQWLQLVFILASVLVFYTACTVFEIPHGALGMEMATDYHERTRLFSAKAFFGNLFAMGTPFLIWLASWPLFKGSGDLVDGMRYVSLLVAVVILPLSAWWFLTLREPLFTSVSRQKKSLFWTEMRSTLSNKTFLSLVAIIFTLAMGFNAVTLFNQYTIIFYLYGGDEFTATDLLAWNGLLWGVTGVLAAFPLNWLSRRFGKKGTLIIAILLMSSAQLAKLVCYSPIYPHLVFIPTVLLSAGMFMFFTLAASMVGDVCDEDELKTGTRTEGSYYSVFWWYIKLGSAVAGFIMGGLVEFTEFDEQQNKLANDARSAVSAVIAHASSVVDDDSTESLDRSLIRSEYDKAAAAASKLTEYWTLDRAAQPRDEHNALLVARLSAFEAELAVAQDQLDSGDVGRTLSSAEQLLLTSQSLKEQAPGTLLWMRIVEISIPIALGLISLVLAVRYPLTEARCREVAAELNRIRDNCNDIR